MYASVAVLQSNDIQRQIEEEGTTSDWVVGMVLTMLLGVCGAIIASAMGRNRRRRLGVALGFGIEFFSAGVVLFAVYMASMIAYQQVCPVTLDCDTTPFIIPIAIGGVLGGLGLVLLVLSIIRLRQSHARVELLYSVLAQRAGAGGVPSGAVPVTMGMPQYAYQQQQPVYAAQPAYGAQYGNHGYGQYPPAQPQYPTQEPISEKQPLVAAPANAGRV